MIIGITGLIGTGKSTLVRFLEKYGAVTHCADQCVHDLYRDKALLNKIGNALVIDHDDLTHVIIMDHIKNNPDNRAKLEAIIHPLVRHSQIAFLEQHAGKALRVLDIPLLFETRAEILCDEIWVTHCSFETQKERVLARPDYDEDKLKTILSWQTDHRDKATRVIDTDKSIEELEAEIETLVRSIL